MEIEELLSRLEKVKPSGTDKWIARCPAHPDKTPSMSVKLTADGTILMHDFGGCSIDDICGAIGIETYDLFPERQNEWQKNPEKPVVFGTLRFSAIDALRCLAGEGSILLLLACDMADGKVLTPADNDRLTTALGRINAAMEYLGDNTIEKHTII